MLLLFVCKVSDFAADMGMETMLMFIIWFIFRDLLSALIGARQKTYSRVTLFFRSLSITC
jgi:hypothetical protein